MDFATKTRGARGAPAGAPAEGLESSNLQDSQGFGHFVWVKKSQSWPFQRVEVPLKDGRKLEDDPFLF